MNSRGQSGQHRVYMYRQGRPLAMFSSLIPGKSYKLRTSETCDVTGHDLFTYDIYLNYTFGWYYHFVPHVFQNKRNNAEGCIFFCCLQSTEINYLYAVVPSGPTYRQRMHLID